MIKDLPPPTEAEEYRNAAEILRDLAAQARFGKDATNSLTVLKQPRWAGQSYRAPISSYVGTVRAT